MSLLATLPKETKGLVPIPDVDRDALGKYAIDRCAIEHDPMPKRSDGRLPPHVLVYCVSGPPWSPRTRRSGAGRIRTRR
ncbi:hypothetical protein GCM10009736_32320 [Actinomadura bangladeshensis]